MIGGGQPKLLGTAALPGYGHAWNELSKPLLRTTVRTDKGTAFKLVLDWPSAAGLFHGWQALPYRWARDRPCHPLMYKGAQFRSSRCYAQFSPLAWDCPLARLSSQGLGKHRPSS